MRATDDFVVRSEKPIRLEAGREAQASFDLPAGAIRVTILDETTGEPVAGAVGYARPADREAGADRFPGFRSKLGWADFTDDAGTVLLPSQIPGAATTVRAFAEGYEEGEVDGVTPGTAKEPATVTVRVARRR